MYLKPKSKAQLFYTISRGNCDPKDDEPAVSSIVQTASGRVTQSIAKIALLS